MKVIVYIVFAALLAMSQIPCITRLHQSGVGQTNRKNKTKMKYTAPRYHK